MDQPVLEIHDFANSDNYGYDGGNDDDWYGVTVETWTDTRIVVHFDPEPPAAGDLVDVNFYAPGEGGGAVATSPQVVVQP